MGTLILTVFLTLFSFLHPVHVSLLNIDIEPDTGNIEIVFKLFSDDFERIILQKYNVQLNITQQVDPGVKIRDVNRYIEESFEMMINDNKIGDWKFVRNDLDDLSIWLYYENKYQGEIESISLKDEVMMDLFDDQTNLVIITYGEKQNGYRLNYRNRSITIRLD
ncbi:MAG: hypothetical protein AMS27_10260 [Bacteroides sp. SM23_62_1]|nr:MAG: hypothetical protein AMS27_10260 [Bacteroides sp. SM23_62_1]